MAEKRGWHLMNFTLHGLPELEYFDSPEKRQAALQQIGKDAGNPVSAWFWGAILLLAGTTVVVLRGARFILGRWGWPTWAAELAAVALCGAAFVFVLRWLHRAGASRELRLKLIEQGVPVCYGCGYRLTGLTASHRRCPECGREFDAEVIRLLGGVAVEPEA